MKLKALLLITTLFLFTTPLTASAFDGERHGFMLNLGLGMGKSFGSGGSTSNTGFATDFKIGGGTSNKVQIYYTNRVLWFSPSYTSSLWAKGMSAGGVSYFLEPESPSFFFSGALGLSAITSSSGGSSDSTLGFSLGVGYEFARNYIAEITFMHAGDHWNSNLMLTVSWLAY